MADSPTRGTGRPMFTHYWRHCTYCLRYTPRKHEVGAFAVWLEVSRVIHRVSQHPVRRDIGLHIALMSEIPCSCERRYRVAVGRARQ